MERILKEIEIVLVIRDPAQFSKKRVKQHLDHLADEGYEISRVGRKFA